jgi:hypothetical protein
LSSGNKKNCEKKKAQTLHEGNAQAIYERRYSGAESPFEGAHAGSEDREGYEALSGGTAQ